MEPPKKPTVVTVLAKVPQVPAADKVRFESRAALGPSPLNPRVDPSHSQLLHHLGLSLKQSYRSFKYFDSRCWVLNRQGGGVQARRLQARGQGVWEGAKGETY